MIRHMGRDVGNDEATVSRRTELKQALPRGVASLREAVELLRAAASHIGARAAAGS